MQFKNTAAGILAISFFITAAWGTVEAQSAITVEAEDAVSTNFAADSVLLFGTGGNRTLQLNERSLLGDTPFYAEYAVYAPQAGTYELWYGGSIPGSQDTLLPSYGSPIVLQVNDEEERELFWENVQVGPTYSSPYRWVLAATVSLQEGLNQVRLEVRERRRFDGRFFLYLDRLVFQPAESDTEPAAAADADADPEEEAAAAAPATSPAPATAGGAAEVLPPREELSDEPEGIEDLLITVRDNPDDIQAWIRLADLYTLVGDHINALRYLNRAAVIEDRNPDIIRRTARNLMWRGDLEGALETYWQLLSADLSQLESFLEAGKIAAWNGFYGASEQYYLAGLENFPENVQIRINLGFTYLWSGQEERARELFQRTEAAADTPQDALHIAREYRVNDDPQRAAAFLERALDRFGDSPELYLDRYDLLLSVGNTAAAEELMAEAPQRVNDPEGLTARLQRIDRTYRLRDELISEFESAAAENPLDPASRRTLAQTYLWTGNLEAGIDQFELLLAVESLRGMRARWDRHAEQAGRAALVAVVERELRAELGRLTAAGSTLNSSLSALESIDEETPQEERDQLIADTREATVRVGEISQRVEEIVAFVEPTAAAEDEELTELLESAQAAWTSVEENSQWTLNLPRTRAELQRASGAVPGIDAHVALTDWILTAERPTPAANLIVGTADETERLLLAWAWATAGADEALARVLEEVPAEAGRLLLYQELFRRESDQEPADSAADTANGGASGAENASGAGGNSVEQARETAQAGTSTVAETQQATSAALRLLREERETRAEALRLQSQVALFELQNETVTLRTQLGGYYVDSGDVERAIVQFETVREVDPTNPDTLFALANAYQQQGRWARAMEAYREIYQLDPTFRNVAALHNRLARSNADRLSAGVRSVAEPTRVVFGTRTDYLHRVNSRFDLAAGLEILGTRILVEDTEEIKRQYFQQGNFTLSAPIRFIGGRLVVEPMLGVDLNGNHLFVLQDADESVMTFVDRSDYFQYWQIEPIVGAALRYSGGPTFTSLSYRYGPYRPAADLPLETAFISRPEYLSHSVTGSLSASLAERPSPFWSRLRSDTSAAADFISGGSDTGQRVAAQQNLGFVLYSQSQPHTRLAAGISTGYEDFFGDDASVDYEVFYRPDEVFQLGSYVSGELYRSGGRETTLGVTGRLYGGLYQTELLHDSRPDPLELESGFRGAADITAEMTYRAVALQLGTSLSRVWDGATESEDFYSIGVSLNLIVTNPSLLAQ